MKNKNERKKIKFKRSRIILTLVYLALTVGVFSSLAFVPRDPDLRYLRHLIVMLGTIFAIITLISFLKLFTREIRMELYRRISQALFNASEKWRSIKATIRRKLGLPERADMRGRDERNIVFDPEKSARRAAKRPPKIKYSEMNDNRRRIRFLWAKYVTEHTKDDPPTISDTPENIKSKIDDAAVNDRIFELYQTARYSPKKYEIADADVLEQAKIIGTKGKI